MYRACLFCQRDLGTNEVVEAFPVGRRLAFDAARGRLWVVCHRCARWNLTPLEERWEAIEACERAFRDTRLRAGTGQVALARLREGLELVRIGAPLRPEMAAWRYGDQFGRRRRRAMLMTAGGTATVAALLWGGPAVGLLSAGGVTAANWLQQLGAQVWLRRVPVTSFNVDVDGEARLLRLARWHVREVQLRVRDGTWVLDAPHLAPGAEGVRALLPSRRSAVQLQGADALHALSRILPHANPWGGTAVEVDAAVEVLASATDVEHLMRAALWPAHSAAAERGWGRPLRGVSRVARLAIEMALHEETERRAMEGELATLEQAWREAEEIAAIADALVLPTALARGMQRLRDRESATPDGA